MVIFIAFYLFGSNCHFILIGCCCLYNDRFQKFHLEFNVVLHHYLVHLAGRLSTHPVHPHLLCKKLLDQFVEPDKVLLRP